MEKYLASTTLSVKIRNAELESQGHYTTLPFPVPSILLTSLLFVLLPFYSPLYMYSTRSRGQHLSPILSRLTSGGSASVTDCPSRCLFGHRTEDIRPLFCFVNVFHPRFQCFIIKLLFIVCMWIFRLTFPQRDMRWLIQ